MFELNGEKVRKYFSEKFGSEYKIKEIKKIGEGFHGIGFSIDVVDRKNQNKRFVLKTLKTEGFGHDYPADRASVVIRSLMDSSLLENHIKVLDAGSIQEDNSLMTFGEPKDFYIIMEEARGVEYWNDLDQIRDKNKLNEKDIEKIKILAQYLATMHKQKYDGPHAEQLYRRVVRDFVGHGELMMGVIDTFPEKMEFATRKELVEIVKKSVEWWDKIKDCSNRLCVVHGDFYPGNIQFDGDKLIVLDRSRFRYGEPADDVTSFTMNLINYSIMSCSEFKDPFKKLFETFFDEYLKKGEDKNLFKVCPLFFAFRGIVCIHPIFYSKEWMVKHGFKKDRVDLINDSKKNIINFVKNVLNEKEFQIKNIDSYLKD
ncbi:MAG: hypothetical protein HZB73_02385 [Nitrosarchaeum sp.]|nr:hypothetical protein [Nitrosarchaeum sp.]